MKTKKKYGEYLLKTLREHYPDAKIELQFSNNFEFLVSVMLSAQTTDKAVNKVTEKLFPKYRGLSELDEIKNFAKIDVHKLEKDINSIGLFRTKAKNIKNTAALIVHNFDGIIPQTMTELTSLPGVGRKTANIILSSAFGIIEGIAVDTHVKRLAKELGLTKSTDPKIIEKDLMGIFDKKDWPFVTTLLIAHGRAKTENILLPFGKF